MTCDRIVRESGFGASPGALSDACSFCSRFKLLIWRMSEWEDVDCLLEGRPDIFLLEILAARCVRGLFELMSVGETSSSVVVNCSGSSDMVTAIVILDSVAIVGEIL